MNATSWLDGLPADWRTVRLKYAAPLRRERADVDGNLDYVGLEDVEPWTGRLLRSTRDVESSEEDDANGRGYFAQGDVLFGKLRPYLAKAFLAEQPGQCSTEFFVMQPGPDLDARFLLHVVLSDPFVRLVDGTTFGAKMPRANWEAVGSLLVPLPPLSEQRQIAAWLDAETAHLDALAAEKERMLALLARRRAARVSRAVTRGLDPDVPMCPSSLHWLGDVPAHWEVRRLKFQAAAPLMYGANEAGLEVDRSHPRFVRITDIAEDGSLRDDTFRSLDPETAAPYLLREGDLLFARSGATVGKAFLYRDDWGVACFAGYLIRFRCDHRSLLPAYLFYYAASNPYWQQIKAGAIQATIQNFSAERYGDLWIPLPPIQEQVALVKHIERTNDQDRTIFDETQQSLVLLAERRRALASAAVTGRLAPEPAS